MSATAVATKAPAASDLDRLKKFHLDTGQAYSNVVRALKLLEGVSAIFDASVDDERGLSEGERWGADYIVAATVDTLEGCRDLLRVSGDGLYEDLQRMGAFSDAAERVLKHTRRELQASMKGRKAVRK